MTAWGWVVGLAAWLVIAWHAPAYAFAGLALTLWTRGVWFLAMQKAEDDAEATRMMDASRIESDATRAAATATRATIADAVSLLPALRCGGGHADHVKRSDVRRILAEPEALR